MLWPRIGICEVYDSLGGTHHQPARLVISMLDQMCLRHTHTSLVDILIIDGWDFILHGSDSPPQTDHSSCGVFVCVAAMCIHLERPVLFSQAEIMYWRLRFAYLLTTHQDVSRCRILPPSVSVDLMVEDGVVILD